MFQHGTNGGLRKRRRKLPNAQRDGLRSRRSRSPGGKEGACYRITGWKQTWTHSSFPPHTPRGRRDLPLHMRRQPAVSSPSIHPVSPSILPLSPFPASPAAIFPVRRKLQWWVWQRGGAAMLGWRIRCDWKKRRGEQREIYGGLSVHFGTFLTKPVSRECSFFFFLVRKPAQLFAARCLPGLK